MANRLYREEAYLEKLELLLRTAKELAACRAQLEALDRRGVPEGSVIFSRPVKRYRRKNGEETVYRYTCEYLYIKGKKYYVSKKHRYPKRPRPGTDENDPETAAAFPFNLCTGARLPFAIHSRLHEVPWLRSLRPVPTCEINTEDAARLGIADGDTVELASPYGRIRVKAKRTCKTKPGTIQMLHGYTEANVNLLIGQDHLDPYSGFPGYKGMRCSIQRCP